MDIIDLFAGPGGWDEGLRLIADKDVLGIENDATACATAEAAGHPRALLDIAQTAPHEVAAEIEGLIASPPCPGFSPAGKGLGLLDFKLLMRAIDDIAHGQDPDRVLERVRAEQHDVRSALTLEPLRWALELEPEWIALEQVPTVLPLWQAYVPVLEQDGYHVTTSFLQAEQYGVPQTRKRAVLIASRRKQVTMPTPTHSKYYPRNPAKLDPGVEKWVSMAEALGHQPEAAVDGDTSWVHHRPSPTIVGSFAPDVVAAPGYRKAGDPPRQKTPGSVRITVEEAAVLQSFRPDYPWQGTKTKQYRAVGSAVPPSLAAHVLAQVVLDQ